jgi:hypothetical protein
VAISSNEWIAWRLMGSTTIPPPLCKGVAIGAGVSTAAEGQGASLTLPALTGSSVFA